MDPTKQPGLQFSQIILVGAKFNHRPDVFALPPTTLVEGMQLHIEAKVGGKPGDPHAIIGIRAFTDDDPELLYRFDVEVAALVSQVPNEENLDPYEYAQNMGAAALYPFLRETVASITLRGRFGPVWLKPFNFALAEGVKTDAVEESQPD
ncbi:MAG: protein-export chaperone SecB [Pyrinomonadaceae bacterium]|nr:protein-export chaperone SecB [Pyrinomonadaceae bacterium]